VSLPATIRTTQPADRQPIQAIADQEALFTAEEAACVSELLEDYLGRPDHNGYFFLTAEVGGEVAGFACYGPTPLTHGTYDLYWVAVGPEFKRQGIGRSLMQQVEQEVRQQGGRMLVADTSGSPAYDRTREFYERLGFQRAATVPDFYREGDPLVLYVKSLQPDRQRTRATVDPSA
jgi:ribosomal protein S18 acetylase RimI-like enzyme